MRTRTKILFALFIVTIMVTIYWPTFLWATAGHSFEFEVFHCATKIAMAHGDPWSLETIQKVCPKQDGPYIYPAPFFLVTFALAIFDQKTAATIWFFVCISACLFAMRTLKRWSGISLPLMVLLLASSSPIVHDLKLGNVNLVVLMLISLALVYNSGSIMAMAVVIKMSPAILVIPAIMEKRFRWLVTWFVTIIILFSISLFLVSPSIQARFLTEILPSFGSRFSNLELPLYKMSHHSISRLVIEVWPSEIVGQLSQKAKMAHQTIILLLLIGLIRNTKYKAWNKYSFGAWLVLMTIAPIFTWEAHLVYLFPPMFIVCTAIEKNRMSKPWTIASTFSIVVIGLPFEWIRWPAIYFPEIDWFCRDIKLFASLVIGAACLELLRSENNSSMR